MSIPQELTKVLRTDPEILGGTLCFAGTRVPVEIFLDYINNGDSLERFLDGYPSVQEDQAKQVLAWQTNNSKHDLGLDIAS